MWPSLTRAGVALVLCLAPASAHGQSNLIALRTVRLTGAGTRTRTAPYVHAQGQRYGTVLGLEFSVGGALWIDLEDPSSTLANIDQVRLTWEGDAAMIRLGVGDVPWGISEVRSPIDGLTPRALLWNSWDGPRLGQPFVGVTLFGGGGTLDAVILPFSRPTHLGGYSWTTWSGRSIRSEGSWDQRFSGGLRFKRTHGPVDLAISYVDGLSLRTASRPEPTFEAKVRPPRTRQLGLELEWVLPVALSLRTEGAISRSGGGLGGRLLAGLEWYPKPYLSALVEHGFTTRNKATRTSLEDDLLLGVRLLGEDVRLQASLFVDPRSGNRHYAAAARWNVRARTSVEFELIGWGGNPLREPPLALRQPSAVTLSFVRFL